MRKPLTDGTGGLTAFWAKVMFLALDRAKMEREDAAADDEIALNTHGFAPCLCPCAPCRAGDHGECER